MTLYYATHIKVNNIVVKSYGAWAVNTLCDYIDKLNEDSSDDESISYVVLNNTIVHITLVGEEAFNAKLIGYDAYVESLYSSIAEWLPNK